MQVKEDLERLEEEKKKIEKSFQNVIVDHSRAEKDSSSWKTKFELGQAEYMKLKKKNDDLTSQIEDLETEKGQFQRTLELVCDYHSLVVSFSNVLEDFK